MQIAIKPSLKYSTSDPDHRRRWAHCGQQYRTEKFCPVLQLEVGWRREKVD
jgi:hypothetical protein